jgi:peptidoglycan hydrolase CwlO-like protein
MHHPDQQVERISEKIQLLVRKQQSLQKINYELRQQVHELQRQRSAQVETIDELQQQLLVLKAAKSELSEDERKTFEKRLGQYIKEIDRCITMLGE